MAEAPHTCPRCGEPLSELDRLHLATGIRRDPEVGCFGCFSPDEEIRELAVIARRLSAQAETYEQLARTERASAPESPLADIYLEWAQRAHDRAADFWRPIFAWHCKRLADLSRAHELIESLGLPEPDAREGEE